MEEIYELIDQLAAKVFEKYGKAVCGSVVFYTDGYRTLNVNATKQDFSLPVEKWKRRALVDVSRTFGEWCEDRSEIMNDYYRRNNLLLEDDE